MQTFLKDRSDLHVHFRADNTTAVAYINNMGGTRSTALVNVAKDIWEYCLRRKIYISAAYLPGKMNLIAD